MSLKKFLGGMAAAGGLLVAAPVGAAANVMWCVGDPPVQVTSSAGTQFVVNTQVYASTKHSALKHSDTVTATSVSDGSGGTLVTVEVTGPAGEYMTVVASVTTAHAKISSQASGTGDVTVVLDVPIA
jgi:hypothetical protein